MSDAATVDLWCDGIGDLLAQLPSGITDLFGVATSRG
ncbi:hypothetical protein EDD30_6725 [Couchioplanes caeruleus]|uniref:Uncharacterized protein n=1 Tax=Couchioplanes caeruleus TaxID=56438 RepID=A0A3N1GTT4_9ACTN|nr:hypothetical protein EDD30_6725 [Couchioplanes caeruleus]